MKLRLSVFFISIALIVITVTPLSAYEWSLGENINIKLKGEMNYTVRMRTDHPHYRLKNLYASDPEAPDYVEMQAPMPQTGNLFYDKWDLTSNKIAQIWELEISSQYVNFFFRDEIFFDAVFTDDKYSDATKAHAMSNMVDSLEYYLEGKYKNFTGRLGRQIIQWGESMAPIQTPTVNVPNALSAMKATSAGYTTRDFYLPNYMLWLNYESSNYSIETVYAPYSDFRDNFMVVGTFGSPVDMIGYGAYSDTMALVDLRPRKFEDMQQYGGAFKMVVPAMNYVEFGLYYFHYVDRAPKMELTEFSLTRPEQTFHFPELDMFGFSAAHTFQTFDLGLSLGLDIAYRPNAPIQKVQYYYELAPALISGHLQDVMGPLGGYEEGETVNWSLSGMKMWFDVMPFTPWTVGCTGMFEFYGGYIFDYKNTTFAYKGRQIERPMYSIPQLVYYYTCGPTFETSDMIDNTKITFGISAMGNLHTRQRHLHAFIFNFKAKYGDSWEASVGYDYKLGDIQEELQPEGGNMFDRDALTIKFVYYFI